MIPAMQDVYAQRRPGELPHGDQQADQLPLPAGQLTESRTGKASPMPFSLGIVGAGQFAGQFAKLFQLHPGVGDVYVTDLLPERAEQLVAAEGLAGTVASFEEHARRRTSTPSRSSPSAGRTARWWCRRCAPASTSTPRCRWRSPRRRSRPIIEAVRETGLTYMMGETSHYNPATVYAREQIADGDFGRLFYAEGDYVHDMDLGFYDAYQYSGGESWKATASYPPMLYPTHSHRRRARRLADARGERQRDRRHGRARRRRLRPGGQPVRQRLLQRDRAVRGRGRRLVPYERVPPGRLPLAHPRVAVPLLRHGGQLRAAGHGQPLAGQEGRAGRLGASAGRPTLSADDPSLARRRARAAGRVHLRHGPGARPLAGCRGSSTQRPTGTRAATTSSSTTSSPPSTTARCRR